MHGVWESLVEWTEAGITTVVDTADAAGQAALDLLAGDEFKGDSQAIVFGLSNGFNKPSPDVQAFFSDTQNINDMVDVMVTIAAMQSAAGIASYSNPKTAILRLTTGINVAKTAAQAAMAAYLVHEFGAAAGVLFEKLTDISDQINALDGLNLCERGIAIQAIQDQLAEMMGEFITNASPGLLKKVLGKINLKKDKKKDEECKTLPYNNRNLTSCYETKGDSWAGISGAKLTALEATLGGAKTTIQECKPK